MSQSERRHLAERIEINVVSAAWIMRHVDCEGPLAHLPTTDPAVQVLLQARRHLLNDAKKARLLLGWV